MPNETPIRPNTPKALPSEIIVLEGMEKIPASELASLNLILLRLGGSYEGRPQFKLSWAADDNSGLAKDHHCGKIDPFDHNCSCLPKSRQIPICFHSVQYCYHLLSLRETGGDVEIVSQFSRQEDTRFTYDCIVHYVDPEGKPVRPTADVMERVVPMLLKSGECMLAARRQMWSTFRREAKQRKAERERQEVLTERRNREFAQDLIREWVPAYSAHTGYGPKTRQFADLRASDVGRIQLVGA